jgi:hypothetical protein
MIAQASVLSNRVPKTYRKLAQGVVQTVGVLVEYQGLLYTSVSRVLAEEPSRFEVQPRGAQVHDLRVTRMSSAASIQE